MSSSAHDGGRPGSLDDRMVKTDDLPPETATTMTEHATDPSGDASDLHADLTTIEPAAPPRVDDVTTGIVVEHLNIYYGDVLAVEPALSPVHARS